MLGDSGGMPGMPGGMPGMMGMPGPGPCGMPGMMPPGMPPGGGTGPGGAGGPGGMPGMMMPGMPGGMGGIMMPGGMPGGMPGMPGPPGGPSPPGMGQTGPGAGQSGPGGLGGMMMPPMPPPAPGAGGGGEEQSGPGGMSGMMPGMMAGMMPGMMPRMMMPNPMMMMMGMMAQAAMMKQAQQNPPGGQEGSSTGPNPLLASMMGGNPLLGAGNPMLAGMMGGGSAGSSSAAPEAAKPQPAEDEIDPDVRELGDYFNIEDRWIKRLNETMKKRRDTKEQDIAKLYEVLERARSPTGLLTVKIGEMECGQFVGKIKPDKDVERLARKFKLDDHVTSRLTELVVRRKGNKEEERARKDLDRIEQHLRYCKRPSAMATLLAGKLLEGEVDELPDLEEAEGIMQKYKLDEDARSKLREIVEKRASDQKDVLVQVRKHLDTSTYPSSMLCKIARPLIDGEKLADPPDRPVRNPGGGGGGGGGGGMNPVARESGGGRDQDRRGGGGDYRDRERRDRSRDRDRRRDRSRDRDR